MTRPQVLGGEGKTPPVTIKRLFLDGSRHAVEGEPENIARRTS